MSSLENLFAYYAMLSLSLLTIIVMIPWPRIILDQVLGLFSRAGHSRNVRILAGLLLFILACLFAYNFFQLKKIENDMEELNKSKLQTLTAVETRMSMQIKLFRQQRNVYICGFSLFLIPILFRFHWILSNPNLQKAISLDEMKKKKDD